MKTITINLYRFGELTEEAKQKAYETWRAMYTRSPEFQKELQSRAEFLDLFGIPDWVDHRSQLDRNFNHEISEKSIYRGKLNGAGMVLIDNYLKKRAQTESKLEALRFSLTEWEKQQERAKKEYYSFKNYEEKAALNDWHFTEKGDIWND